MSFIFLQALNSDEWVSKDHLVSFSIREDIINAHPNKLDSQGNPSGEQTPIYRLYAKDVNGEGFILFEHTDRAMCVEALNNTARKYGMYLRKVEREEE